MAAKKKQELRLGTGWSPDPVDPRDLTAHHDQVRDAMKKVGLRRLERGRRRLPPKVDLSEWAGPVYFQGGFNTCNSHVVAGLVTYFENRAFGKSLAPSRLFLYKVARNLLQTTDDAGVYIRQVMGVLKLFGVPPERYWPYPDPGTMTQPRSSDPLLDAEPSAFCYAVADDYQAISYYRLDEPNQDPGDLLRLAKAHLAAKISFTLGFPLYRSILGAKTTGRIPYPAAPEKPLSTHAVLAMGYDDAVEIAGDGAMNTTGAFLIKNSWSEDWGEKGYGWLPYQFLLEGHCRDFWTLTQAEWVDTGCFELPA
jgi:C1A family cysteine protease